ncbi:hypothetical protein HYC85_032143 [Camellia sinensis]|uniref:Subtilisin-like protease fibronectin type-III domain-containing protein n=1 Tax=Camellia sinensis TaxID=4442 RepID=A0A7J7FSB7_CAMSI|nr:hypothetical protein HYC85_032143 [Camellia sinensis]
MTTAKITDHSGRSIMDGDKPTGVFATGAGHVNPKRAINPGLVYDIRPDEYFTHLCTMGYKKLEIFTITHRNVSCHETLLENRGFNINYPSISVMFTSRKMSKVIKRQLTNVGSPNSIYSVEVVEPEGVKTNIQIYEPAVELQSLDYFKEENNNKNMSSTQGHLIWVHFDKGLSRVRSPISVTWASKKQQQ